MASIDWLIDLIPVFGEFEEVHETVIVQKAPPICCSGIIARLLCSDCFLHILSIWNRNHANIRIVNLIHSAASAIRLQKSGEIFSSVFIFCWTVIILISSEFMMLFCISRLRRMTKKNMARTSRARNFHSFGIYWLIVKWLWDQMDMMYALGNTITTTFSALLGFLPMTHIVMISCFQEHIDCVYTQMWQPYFQVTVNRFLLRNPWAIVNR